MTLGRRYPRFYDLVTPTNSRRLMLNYVGKTGSRRLYSHLRDPAGLTCRNLNPLARACCFPSHRPGRANICRVSHGCGFAAVG